ncbi:MAG: flagellar basal body-associated FliL family protein [Desulfobacterales bacterium]|nr:flagellar basal body-associated FliL family protein [Desulfobacterales bacterium]MDJ0882580.1 flagellar basal body-associated FliL family protein [Desulfobacterales bacterium]
MADKERNTNKIILIAVIAVAVLFVGAVGGGFYMMWNKLADLDALVRPEEEEVDEETDDGLSTIGAMFPLDTFIVNLADEERKRYLRVTMQIELKEGEPVEILEQRLVQVRDIILMILPTKRFQEIRSVNGKTVLRQEIMTRLNDLLKKEVINNIYFTEFVVQ